MSVPVAPSDPASITASDLPPPPRPMQTYWLWVLCLLGVDYFSTLAYQPSITFQVAGRLAPFATVVVVLVTLLGALPVYLYVAGRSAQGEGSIALLEKLVSGWHGKTIILILLGFAATDFVMIKTISLADAAEHVTRNSYVVAEQPLSRLAEYARALSLEYLGERFTDYFNEQLVVTILLGILGFVFWFLLRKGFSRNVLILAVPVVGLYLLLNGIVIGAGLVYLGRHPERFERWFEQVGQGDWAIADVSSGGDGWALVIVLSLLFLPQLALGLSGFEMSMIVMPQVTGKPDDDPRRPRGRIRNMRKILVVAAVIMSIYLLGSATVTATLIPADEFLDKKIDPKSGAESRGEAVNRALAYLAHGSRLTAGPGEDTLNPLFGPKFGTLYDAVTIVLLCLAGTSVITALSVLLPRFLLRFGMELPWAHKWGVLLGLFALLNLAVTLYFRADVNDQRGAYATGVLVLMSNAALASVLGRRREKLEKGKQGFPWFYGIVSVLFLATTATIVATAPTGLLISFAFIVTVLVSSVLARAVRADELRTVGFAFADEKSKFLWDSLRLADFPILVPHRPGLHEREEKEKAIRLDHQFAPDADIVFLEVEVDDPSNFYQKLLIEVFREEKRLIIKATRCVSVAHAIAAIALEMSRHSKPPGVHFGWSEMDLLAASWSYFAFGEGNIPWKVRELIRQAETDSQRRPRVIIG